MGLMKSTRFEDLPASRVCNQCGVEKMREDMIIQFHKSTKVYYFRPRCKDCNNMAERGHRREYKRKYLRTWRKRNAAVNESYWKGNEDVREAARVRAANRSREENDAIAIQRRLRNHGESVTIGEARELLALYGRCYPTRFGLTGKGLRRCEQIRSRLRNKVEKRGATKQQWDRRRMLSSFEIRVMVYEESEEESGLVIPPDEQPIPYQKAAERLRNWHRDRRSLSAAAGMAVTQ